MHTCEVCGGKVGELRRGRCWGCYNRWVETRPVGLGASCCMCNERRRDFLKSVELLGAWVPTCHNCASRVAQLSPLPKSIAEIRSALRRDRRRADRRWGKRDQRVFQHDRRQGDRRIGRDAYDVVDDDMIVEIGDLADELAALAARVEVDTPELTRIRERPLFILDEQSGAYRRTG